VKIGTVQDILERNLSIAAVKRQFDRHIAHTNAIEKIGVCGSDLLWRDLSIIGKEMMVWHHVAGTTRIEYFSSRIGECGISDGISGFIRFISRSDMIWFEKFGAINDWQTCGFPNKVIQSLLINGVSGPSIAISSLINISKRSSGFA